MNAELVELLITDFMWLLVIAAWVILIVIGLEADKPLSGGIPGHVEIHDHQHPVQQWGVGDRLGEIGGWVVFGLVALLLPIVLYWILMVHPR